MTGKHDSLIKAMESYGVPVEKMRRVTNWDELVNSAIAHTPIDEPFGVEDIVFEMTGMKVGRFAAGLELVPVPSALT